MSNDFLDVLVKKIAPVAWISGCGAELSSRWLAYRVFSLQHLLLNPIGIPSFITLGSATLAFVSGRSFCYLLEQVLKIKQVALLNFLESNCGIFSSFGALAALSRFKIIPLTFDQGLPFVFIGTLVYVFFLTTVRQVNRSFPTERQVPIEKTPPPKIDLSIPLELHNKLPGPPTSQIQCLVEITDGKTSSSGDITVRQVNRSIPTERQVPIETTPPPQIDPSIPLELQNKLPGPPTSQIQYLVEITDDKTSSSGDIIYDRYIAVPSRYKMWYGMISRCNSLSRMEIKPIDLSKTKYNTRFFDYEGFMTTAGYGCLDARNFELSQRYIKLLKVFENGSFRDPRLNEKIDLKKLQGV